MINHRNQVIKYLTDYPELLQIALELGAEGYMRPLTACEIFESECKWALGCMHDTRVRFLRSKGYQYSNWVTLWLDTLAEEFFGFAPCEQLDPTKEGDGSKLSAECLKNLTMRQWVYFALHARRNSIPRYLDGRMWVAEGIEFENSLETFEDRSARIRSKFSQDDYRVLVFRSMYDEFGVKTWVAMDETVVDSFSDHYNMVLVVCPSGRIMWDTWSFAPLWEGFKTIDGKAKTLEYKVKFEKDIYPLREKIRPRWKEAKFR